jgi:hypothetical protein
MKLVHVVIFPLATALACCGGTVIKSSEDSGGSGHGDSAGGGSADSGSSGSGDGSGTANGDADAGSQAEGDANTVYCALYGGVVDAAADPAEVGAIKQCTPQYPYCACVRCETCGGCNCCPTSMVSNGAPCMPPPDGSP